MPEIKHYPELGTLITYSVGEKHPNFELQRGVWFWLRWQWFKLMVRLGLR